MKSSSYQIPRRIALATLVVGILSAANFGTAWAAASATTVLTPASTPAPAPARSVFIKPTSPQEGHDPFFPESIRPYGAPTAPSTPKVEWTSLKLVGVSGTPDHRLVIINNNTFAEGDEQEVPATGGRVHVRCLRIGPDSVSILVAGQTRELDFSTIK